MPTAHFPDSLTGATPLGARRNATVPMRLTLAFDVNGTPEQVWQAIATGPGNSAAVAKSRNWLVSW